MGLKTHAASAAFRGPEEAAEKPELMANLSKTSRLIPSKAAVQFIELNVRAEARTLQILSFSAACEGPCFLRTPFRGPEGPSAIRNGPDAASQNLL